ncbi:MAG: permease [Patescibacteria group bacterium]|nr:permease [Patescibacteria group bacterium]
MNNQLKFLLAIIFLYLIVALLDIGIVENALINFLIMSLKIVPVLCLVFIIMVLIELYFTKKRVGKYLGSKSGIKGWFYAIISGILISGPAYTLYPLLGELKKNGMKNSLLAVVLYNRNVKIPFLPAMVYYFGLNFTIILSLYIIIFSIFNGKIVELLASKRG